MLEKLLSKLLGDQARSPKAGTFFGWLVSRHMESENTPMAIHMVQVLDPKPKSVIVELGPGAGQAVEELFKNNDPSRIYGIEISDKFRTMLSSKFASELESEGEKRLSIHENDAKSLPFIADASVNYILANNVIYFLDPLSDYMKEMLRILKPGGKIVWGVVGVAENNDSTYFKNTDWDVCMQVMKDSGFVNVSRGDTVNAGAFKCFPLVGFKPDKN